MDDTSAPAREAQNSGPKGAQIEHVSDTALMVAACRALETDRPDGLVRDPFARRLAGERGMAIARASPILDWMCFGVGIRARFIDELLTESLAGGRIQTVVNLGAGLDTRPWRLALNSGLRWIEADFPEILKYKAERLRDVPPRCRLEQLPANLAGPEARDALFGRVGAAEALMITEGLLMYLPQTAVVGLAADSERLTGIRYWLLDAVSPDMMRMAAGGAKGPAEKFRPEDYLAGQALLDAIEGAGWKISARRTYARDGAAAAAARVASLQESRKKFGGTTQVGADDVSGIYLFMRHGA